MLTSIAAVVLGYGLGCIPSAYIAGRLSRGEDIRRLGDGNVGVDNAVRNLGTRAGALVFSGDVFKGALAILLSRILGASELITLSSGLAVVVGHSWPVTLQFRGGRGAAPTLGVMLALIPIASLLLMAVGILYYLLKHNSIVACAIFFAPLPLLAWWMGYPYSLVNYAIGVPVLLGMIHVYKVVLPQYLQQRAASR